MIVLIKQKLGSVSIIGIIQTKKVRKVAYENAVFVKGTLVFKYSCHVSGKPSHQGIGLCVLGQFTHKS